MTSSFRVHNRIDQTEKDLKEFNNELRNTSHNETLFRLGKPVIILEGFDSEDDDISVGVQRALHLRRCREASGLIGIRQ